VTSRSRRSVENHFFLSYNLTLATLVTIVAVFGYGDSCHQCGRAKLGAQISIPATIIQLYYIQPTATI